jgi:hypothetical protein
MDAKLFAAEIWRANMRDVDAHFSAELDALYERWLATDMSAIELDNHRAGIASAKRAAIEGERQLYYLNCADPAGWGSAVR